LNAEVPPLVDATPPTYAPSPLPDAFRVWAMIADAGVHEDLRSQMFRLLTAPVTPHPSVRAFQELLYREFMTTPA